MATEKSSEAKTKRAPRNTRWVLKWLDLPHQIETAAYRITDQSGESRTIHVRKNKRCILDGLNERPMYCASPCRLSQYVTEFREEQGLSIETEWYSNDISTGRKRCGVYFLRDAVARIDGQEAPQ
ncbi:hypothetical protein RA28_10760 [Ruegeria sp. ANG-S4]|uniref:hypothetical protein n=1 Tax=Ruegeria sp. ANG-S4 TaxID=1577904 RepID=UPI00057C6E06|nr:hypothetical protein [Ruegeria sp. ANG-S4]KIC44979.1 hypothetical protein RA28_10760 [Ruegeria sp. ANG-S4]